MPTFLYFEECFKRNGTSIMRRRVDIHTLSEPGNILSRRQLLSKDQEYTLFRRYNYLKYRTLSAVAGFGWLSLMGDEGAMKQRMSSLKAEKLRAAEAFLSAAEEIRNAIVGLNARLVVRPVSRYERGDSARRDELISDSCTHLMKAVERFDYRRGLKFSTYCVNVIKNNLYRDFLTESGRRRKIGVDEESVGAAVSLDRPDTRAYDSDFALKAVSMLDLRERTVIEGLFGINREKVMFRDMVSELGVSRETIRKIKKKAMASISLMPYDPPA